MSTVFANVENHGIYTDLMRKFRDEGYVVYVIHPNERRLGKPTEVKTVGGIHCLGVRTLIDKQKGDHNGSLGSFGWTGGFGTWCEADPEDGVSIVYMHNSVPNDEKFYLLNVRAAAYGFIC